MLIWCPLLGPREWATQIWRHHPERIQIELLASTVNDMVLHLEPIERPIHNCLQNLIGSPSGSGISMVFREELSNE